MDVERLLKLGEKLGLQGEELRLWVDQKVEDERREKEKERQDKEREREVATEQMKLERERIKEQSHLVERQMELERLKLENPSHQHPVSFAEESHSTRSSAVKSPRLPCFDDAKDQIDSYLLRFERYASVNNWERSDLAIHLSALLRGKSLEVYSRLDEDDATDYDKVKAALLKRYNLTEDGFQDRFRKSRPEQGERMSQFQTRIATYLEKWLELSGKDKKVAADVLDLIMKEQLMNVCNKELLVFLKERKPKTSAEVVDLAEKYIEAHGSSGAFSKSGSPHEKVKESSTHSSNGTDKKVSRSSNGVVCHNCHRAGHMARDCRARKHVAAATVDLICTFCRRKGHRLEDCWERKRKEVTAPRPQVAALTNAPETGQCAGHDKLELKCGCQLPRMSAACTGHVQQAPGMPVADGWLNGRKVKVLRDSGSSCVVIKKGLIGRKGNNQTKKVLVYLADGKAVKAPVTEALLECPYFTGEVSALEMDSPLYDVILGNIPGAKCPGTPIDTRLGSKTQESGKTDQCVIDTRLDADESLAVETRIQKQRQVKDLITAPSVETGISVEELIEKQGKDETLKAAREAAMSDKVKKTGANNTSWYTLEKGLLVRYFQSPKVEYGDAMRQVVVPQELRDSVMRLAHESILSGHLAAKKTTERILSNFYWPNIWDNVSRFCRSCDQCQRSTPKGTTAKVPLAKVPLIDEPFSRVAVDLIGPILPASNSGKRYILTVVDYCTRYPEAVALKSIDTERVAEGLVDIFSRVGIPKEMLSDRGTQFTSDLMKEVCRLLSVKQITTSPYHPQCNGLVEKFNATLKGMLKRLAAERPSDWDRYVNAALFAYREAPQESLGFSPFELLYGRPVRGPMTILRELWTEDIQSEEVKTTYQYVVDLREKMDRSIQVAHQNLRHASARYKAHFDKKAKPRAFREGDKVLLLLPTKQNKLELKWQGPFVVERVVGSNNYSIDTGHGKRTYHANLLKQYYDRAHSAEKEVGVFQCAVAAVIEDEEEEGSEAMKVLTKVETPALKQTEGVNDVFICDGLDSVKRDQVQKILLSYKDVLTDVPGRTSSFEYGLKLTSDLPIRKKPYPVPQALKGTLREEVEAMLRAGIVEHSNSPYCSPSVVVKKKDGTNRYCVDFRALNNITVFDAEPMPRLDDLFQEIGTSCNYVSKFDLTKGYWQIPLTEESKAKTAFATELGLMQFTVLPFGLQCAPSAFSRMMRKVVGDLPNVKNYIDDILIHTATWDDHLRTIRSVFQRLREAGLTARPSKCVFGFPEVEFLGHRIGSGKLSPTIDKVEAIRAAKPPENKKQMRSFLGLAGFYRRYVPNFSAVVSPLTDATRKGMPNRIQWADPQERAFNYIKQTLTEAPVLRLPDFERPFTLSTDASDTGVGAVLTQDFDDGRFPVVYMSRKLLPREQRYSVVEKECLALVWAVKSLNVYLMGREFIVETDHAPLLYLNKAKSENGRLMRWALLLHQYRFRLKAVKGVDNHGPDFLSRRD